MTDARDTALAQATAKAQIQQAAAAFGSGDRDHAADLVVDIVRTDPPLGATWGTVSRLAQALGEVSSALSAAERHAQAEPNDGLVRFNLAGLLAQYGRSAQAMSVAEEVLDANPQQAAAWHLRGSLRAQKGEAAGALSDFRRSVALSTDSLSASRSLLALAEGKRFSDTTDPDLQTIQALRDRLSGVAPSDHQAAIFYALGKANDDLGLTEEAFSAYARGAGLMAGRPAPAEGAASAFVDSIISGFTAEFLRALPSSAESSNRPIFVLGAPRSGTTLVEQILVSHSQVHDSAEINLFRAAATPVGGFSPKAVATFAKARPDGLTRVAGAYLRMLDQRFGDRGRIVDKTLNHSRFLGLIHRTLPEARFIWLRRDPGAVAWSCFRTWFAQGVDWSWSLEAIGQRLKDEDRLHAHWTDVMGDAILTVPYEDLVHDPEPWIARILAHVGLPFEAGLEAFHRTERAVTTASFAQVRRPIYKTSTDAWHRYRAHLAPFFERYTSR